MRTIDLPITIREGLPDPEFSLRAPDSWDGRSPVEVVPMITNLEAMRAAGCAGVEITWDLANIAW